MKRLTDAADRFLRASSWKDIAVLKFCLMALGILMGLAVPARKKKPAAWAAALVFLATDLPLMAKFLPCLLEEPPISAPECGKTVVKSREIVYDR